MAQATWSCRFVCDGEDQPKLLARYLKRLEKKTDLILDIDVTVMQSYKSSAETTYKMFLGYTPMVGHINGGYVISSQFRSGNIAPADHNLDFVKRCVAHLPTERSLRYLLLPYRRTCLQPLHPIQADLSAKLAKAYHPNDPLTNSTILQAKS